MNASTNIVSQGRPTRLLLAAVVLLSVSTLCRDAWAIFRCEDRSGRVTYSNLPCPANAQTVRRVDDSPPIVVHEGAEQARTAAGGASTSPASAVASAHVAPRIEATRVEPARNPIEEDRRITAQYNAQRRDCEQRARRLQFLQEDLRAALPVARSSAELALRRAQNEYQQLCPKQR